MANGKELEQRPGHQSREVNYGDGGAEDGGDSSKNYSLKASLKTRVEINTDKKGKTTLA